MFLLGKDLKLPYFAISMDLKFGKKVINALKTVIVEVSLLQKIVKKINEKEIRYQVCYLMINWITSSSAITAS